MERQQAREAVAPQRQPQPQPHGDTASTDATKRTAGIAALYDDRAVVNLTTISCSPPCATPGPPQRGWRRRGAGSHHEKTPPTMMTPTTTGSLAMQRPAKEVVELQGVRPRDRGVIFRAITRMGEELGRFCRGEQGIRSLCKSLVAVVLKASTTIRRGTTPPRKKSRRPAGRGQ